MSWVLHYRASDGGVDELAEVVFARVGERLHPLLETPFAHEEELQQLVTQHPELLAGAQMDPGSPRRFAPISREVPVPDRLEGSASWALDHLFVDQQRCRPRWRSSGQPTPSCDVRSSANCSTLPPTRCATGASMM
jgi:hypothetical protein